MNSAIIVMGQQPLIDNSLDDFNVINGEKLSINTDESDNGDDDVGSNFSL